jgi:predicted small secreted protein
MIDHSIFQNKTAAYYTLGCKLNFAETSAIGRQLYNAGITRVRKDQNHQYLLLLIRSLYHPPELPVQPA